MLKPLEINNRFKKRKGPVLLVIMDGVGFGKYKEGDAVLNSLTPHLDNLIKKYPFTKLKAHGKAVGLPSDDDMGNSEVGHNAMGCGRVFSQGAMLVSDSIKTGRMFEGATWKKLVSNIVPTGKTLHFIGLFSDGNVHSHMDHLKAMIEKAKDDKVSRVRVHILLDGRDVGETSALEYINPFEEYLGSLKSPSFDCAIASGGGRMAITMDRYGANWKMVEDGWKTHVLGEGRMFKSAKEAVETLRSETGAIDQDIKPFIIEKEGKAAGTIEDGDSVIFFNFRGDRALEITEAFEKKDFNKFDRKRYPDVQYAGMMEYDGDLHVPAQYLVEPPSIDRTMGEYLASSGVKTLAISETQKYGHVTYFFNGNRTGKFDEKLEDYVEILSDVVPFEERPWMKCADITDKVIDALKSGEYDYIRLNFPNGDMVGHTGIYEAVVCSMEALDLCLGRLIKAVTETSGVMVVTADHGNADDMYEHDKNGVVKIKENGKPRAKTSHSLNPVPCVVYDPDYEGEYDKKLNEGLGISSIAATCIELLGFKAPEDYDNSVLNWK
ncbi:MAG: 2,3-bisphosphoglycerate-independent phosphoglycerate mutase [Spirochaetia bacterium]|jgi:2,3-bisphosphoglycerate-independent phosphoglycerate mutase|nr:2,3-bisphosphoglycerate-independent phosphoglycerate mutase [Spirochaetia bacterium]